MPLVRLGAIVFLLTAQQCGSSLEKYDAVVAEARRCGSGGPCAIAGGVPGCRCPVAVRADAKERVDAAARGVACPPNERLYCPPLRDPRCESSVCVAEQVLE